MAKTAALAVAPFGDVTCHGALHAPAGTTAVIWTSESTVNAAATAHSDTPVVPVK